MAEGVDDYGRGFKRDIVRVKFATPVVQGKIISTHVK